MSQPKVLTMNLIDGNPNATSIHFEWHKYTATGINPKTNRKNTVRIIAKNELAAAGILSDKGLLPPYTFTEEKFAPPTDAQIDFARDLGIKILPDMNRYDVSNCISKVLNYDVDADETLKLFAYYRNISFSPYAGQQELMEKIFYTLSSDEKILFFFLAVYNFLFKKDEWNFDFPLAQKFLKLHFDDESFRKSLENNYKGNDLSFFGTKDNEDGTVSFGGSTRTKAYNSVVKFLKLKE